MSGQQLLQLGQELSTNGQTVQVKSGFQQVVNGMNYAVVLNHSTQAEDCFVMFNLISYLPTKKLTVFESSFANHSTLKSAMDHQIADCGEVVTAALASSFYNASPALLGGFSLMNEEQKQQLEQVLSSDRHHIRIELGYQQVVNGMNYALNLTSELSSDPCFFMINLVTHSQPSQLTVFSETLPTYPSMVKSMGSLPPCPLVLDLTVRSQFDSKPIPVLGGFQLMSNEQLLQLNLRFSTIDEPLDFLGGYSQVVNGMNYAAVLKSKSFPEPCFQLFHLIAYKIPQELTLLKEHTPNSDLLQLALGGAQPCTEEAREVLNTNFQLQQPSTKMSLPELKATSPQNMDVAKHQVFQNQSDILEEKVQDLFLVQPPTSGQWNPFQGLEMMSLNRFVLSTDHDVEVNENGFFRPTQSHTEYLFLVHKETQSKDLQGCVMMVLVSNQSMSYPTFVNAAEDDSWQDLFTDKPPCSLEMQSQFQTDFNAKVLSEKQASLDLIQSSQPSLLGGHSSLNVEALQNVNQILQAKYSNYEAKLGVSQVTTGIDYLVIVHNSTSNLLCVLHFNFIVLSQKPKFTLHQDSVEFEVNGSFGDLPLCQEDMFEMLVHPERLLI